MADRCRRERQAEVLLRRKPRGSPEIKGRYLWIDEGKTVNARRHLEVPSVLSPYLMQLARGKRPDELLFGLSVSTGRPRPRQSMHRTVQTICEKAGVRRICTHSLHGLWATLAVQSGAASHAVAESLGHHSFAVTQKNYAQPAAVSNAATARVLDMLAKSHGTGKLSAEELLHHLDEETLAKLTELLSASGVSAGQRNDQTGVSGIDPQSIPEPSN